MAPEGVVVSVASVELKLPVLDILAPAIVVHACPPNVMVTSPPAGSQPEPDTVAVLPASPPVGLTLIFGVTVNGTAAVALLAAPSIA
jgi:hypothetical protein